jgi:cation diffusion facilitator CzcD-associated flavoprotein CzcO
VGGGLAGFVAYATLRFGGLEPAEIAVFTTDEDPAAVWRRRAAAIRQRRMRSESDGHCLPRSFPGLAVRAARRRLSVAPLLRTLADAYHPTVEEFLEHVDELRARSGWDLSLVRRRVDSVRAVDEGFQLDGQGPFRHVLLAPGHPGLAVPDELRDDPRVVHAYAEHEYASRVAVIGAGMAAATEWLNALDAAAEVVSMRRREPLRRPLNLPRTLFTRRGLTGFHALARGDRAAFLRDALAPSYPPGRAWDAPVARAARDGRFRTGCSLHVDPRVEQIVCATGFLRGYRHDPLLRRLVEEHGLEAEERWIVLAPDSTVPALSDATRTLSLAGVPAQWAFPAADTLVGAKYAAHRFLRRIQACPSR